MKHFWALPAVLRVAIASQHAFSVHDDLLAYPQYEVELSTALVSEDEAASRLAYAASQSARSSPQESLRPGDLAHQGIATAQGSREGDQSEPLELYDYEAMLLHGKRYLCNIPIVKPVEKNETTTTTSPDEERKELMRATDRGWELLKGLQGNCIYYLSGWWSYSFCYNAEIKQFHQLPPGKGVPIYPPVEDPNVQSYLLGTYEPHRDSSRGASDDPKRDGDVARLETKGETRYLVQKLAGGTICDLTGRERRIEVQFHCHPHSADRIGMIKEVSTCSYLMVVYTPRLCNDVAFLPPQQNRANKISCREIVQEKDIGYRKAASYSANEHSILQEVAPDRVTIGGVEVGGKKEVGMEGKVIEKSVVVGGGKETFVETIASSDGRTLSAKELKKLNIPDPKEVEKIKRNLARIAKGKGWKLDLVDTPRGREFKGIIEADNDGGDSKRDQNGDDEAEDGEGSEETYKDEL